MYDTAQHRHFFLLCTNRILLQLLICVITYVITRYRSLNLQVEIVDERESTMLVVNFENLRSHTFALCHAWIVHKGNSDIPQVTQLLWKPRKL